MYPGQRGGAGSVDFLLRGCSTYKAEFRGRISKDVNEVFQHWNSLKVETDVHYGNDGSSATLLVLTGTVPIFYNGVQYNIPMTFWITKDYPTSPPLVYVTPTATMQIARNHDNVSPEGAVYLPYLNQWNPSRSSLNGLINTCKATFSQMPPVHARAPDDTPPPPPTAVAAARPPPAYGAYPGSQPPGSQPPPPVPAHQQHQQSSYPGARYPGSSGTTPPPPPYPSPGGAGPGPARPSPAAMLGRASADEKAQLEARKERELKTARQAVEIKLQEHYRRFRERMKAELEEEMITQRKLEEGEKVLEEGIRKLNDQKAEFIKAISELDTKSVQLSSWLEEYEREGEEGGDAVAQVSLDEAIVPGDAASRQLFDCVSETGAVDDVLYHLDRALTNDAIELPTFLKEVRKLSRKQFMSKALAQKIQRHQQKIEMQSRQPPPLNSRPPPYQRYS